MALLFIQGIRLVMRDGLNHRNAAVVGVSFWVGVGFQNQWIFPDLLGDGFAGVLLGNGMTAGAMAAVLMVGFMELMGTRQWCLRVPLDVETLGTVREFLESHAARARWNPDSIRKLTAAAEETLDILAQDDTADGADMPRRLAMNTRINSNLAVVEFATLIDATNLEDKLAYVSDLPPVPDERELSFRLLRHYASSVRHQSYDGIDIVEISVDQVP